MNRRLELLFATLIVALAALLRLGWPGITEFKQDEAHLYLLALRLAEFKEFPLRGIGSSIGLPNSPLSVYLFALPLFVWKSPLAATLFVGALNTVSVALAYALARRYLGPRAALISALLYAAAPWAVIYSRKIWAQDLLPLFVTGWAFAGMLAFAEGRRGWLAAHLVLLAVVVQIHLSAVALVPVTLLALFVFRRHVDWRALSLGLLGAALTALPFAFYALNRSGDGMAGSLSTFLAAHSLKIDGEAAALAALVIRGAEIHSLAGAQAFRTFLATAPNLDPILWLGAALVGFGAALGAWLWVIGARAALPPALQAVRLLALWLAAPILFFTARLTPVFPHYFIILFPAPYLLAGVFLDTLLARAHTLWRAMLLWLVPLAVAASQVWLLVALHRFIGAQNTPGAFGTPLGMLSKVAETAKRWGAEDVLVVSDGVDPNVDLVPAVFEALLHDVPHRFVDGRTTAVFPQGAATAILWPGAQPAGERYQAWGGGQWSQTVSLRAGEGDAHIVRAEGISLDVPQPLEASALLSNGVEILGSGGEAQLWELWWRAPEGRAGEDYHVFAHLLDANGERVAQADEATLPTRDWRAGDVVVNYFALEGKGAAVRAGMYAYPSLAPVTVLDAAGNPAGEWIVFPLSPP